MINELHISQTAIKNGIYMKPLSKQQILVNLLIVLVEHHIKEFGYTEFAKKYLDYCIKSDPKSIRAWSYKSNCETIELQKEIIAKKIPFSDLKNYPELQKKHQDLIKLYQSIDELEH